jgi:hypothetical protein
MSRTGKSVIGAVILCVISGVAANMSVAGPRNDLKAGYQTARETTLLGTVSSFTADSETGPLGAHVKVQTPSGVVDVHVGSADFLKLNGLTLNSGDSVRIIGESFVNGTNTVFLARIIQKGPLAVAVRSPQGMPLWPAGSRIVNAKKQDGAL